MGIGRGKKRKEIPYEDDTYIESICVNERNDSRIVKVFGADVMKSEELSPQS